MVARKPNDSAESQKSTESDHKANLSVHHGVGKVLIGVESPELQLAIILDSWIDDRVIDDVLEDVGKELKHILATASEVDHDGASISTSGPSPADRREW